MGKLYLRLGFKYGIMGAAACILLFIGAWYFGMSPITSIRNFGFLILPIVIFFGVKEFRDYLNAGTLHFWQGLTIGFFTYFILAVITTWFIYIFVSYISPDTLQTYQNELTELMLSKQKQWVEGGIPQEKFDSELANIKNYTARLLATNDFLWKVGPGFFVTLIVSMIMRSVKRFSK